MGIEFNRGKSVPLTCPDVGERLKPRPPLHLHAVSGDASIEPTDADLGIDINVMTAEAISMEATKYLPAAIAAIRQQRLAEHAAKQSEQGVSE